MIIQLVPGMSLYFCSHTTLLNDSLLILYSKYVLLIVQLYRVIYLLQIFLKIVVF